MIETVEQLKQLRPDLVELFESLTHEQLLNQIYLEVIDTLNMKERVEIFMSECTGMSKTTYTPDVIKTLIYEHKEREKELLMESILEDTYEMSAEEIKEYLRKV